MYVRYATKNDGKEPKINQIHWSQSPPVNANEQTKLTNEFCVGRVQMCELIDVV